MTSLVGIEQLMSGNVSKSRSNEFKWVVDLRSFEIPCDRLIKRWKDSVISSMGKSLGEFNDLRILIS
jgi:hypothetical protein